MTSAITSPLPPQAKQVKRLVIFLIEKDGLRSSCPGRRHRPIPLGLRLKPKSVATDMIEIARRRSRSNLLPRGRTDRTDREDAMTLSRTISRQGRGISVVAISEYSAAATLLNRPSSTRPDDRLCQCRLSPKIYRKSGRFAHDQTRSLQLVPATSLLARDGGAAVAPRLHDRTFCRRHLHRPLA